MSDRVRLMRVAVGEAPADLLVTGAEVVNVYTGEVVRWDVGVVGEQVAAVGPDLRGLRGPATEWIDAPGRVLVPGFIDGHTHADILVTVPEFLREAMPRGLTALVTEMGQLTTTLGLAGARWFLDGLRAQPIHAFATAPVIPFLTSDDGTGRPVIGERDLLALLDDPIVLGLGEVYWHRLLPEPEALLPLIERAQALGKVVEGHSAGARGGKLVAYAATGVGSCHEPITAAEALERLRLGLHVFIREGSVRRDLEAVLAIRGEPVDLRRAALASDGTWPPDLVARGHMDAIVQKAIDLGLPPIQAYQMASLNVAEHYRLDGRLGGIAPGRSADLVLLPDLRTVQPELVIARGKVVGRGRQCVVPLPPTRLPAELYGGPRVGAIEPAAFRLAAPGREAHVRVIRLAGDIVTAEASARLPVRLGGVSPAAGRDFLLAAAFHRRGASDRALAIVQGFGLREGAVASTLCFDTGDLVAVGASPEALTAAVRRVVELRGGFAVAAAGGRIVAELPLPVGGIASPEPAAAVAREMERVQQACQALGCPLPNPLLTLQALTFSAIPALRLTSRGLLHVKTQQYLPPLL